MTNLETGEDFQRLGYELEAGQEVALELAKTGQRSLVAAVHWVMKSRTQLSNFTFTFHFHSLEKEMATPSSNLA